MSRRSLVTSVCVGTIALAASYLTAFAQATEATALASVSGPSDSAAEAPQVDRNVIFGMYSGLALVMDVYRPAMPNGYGVVGIQGSGWYSPMRYDAAPISQGSEVVSYAQVLTGAGYTVFAINHRAAPRFHYPAAVEDVRRAVRSFGTMRLPTVCEESVSARLVRRLAATWLFCSVLWMVMPIRPTPTP